MEKVNTKSFKEYKRKQSKVFLGGTCNETIWRDKLMPLLEVDYFNPVVDDWTDECQAEEERQKNDECNVHLYVITPEMTGVFSIAEAVQSSNTNTKNIKTVFVLPDKNTGDCFNWKKPYFTRSQWKSLNATARLIKRNGGKIFYNLETAASYINKWG